MFSDSRKEIKFTFNNKSNFYINKYIKKKNNLKKLYPNREINSIYYDNDELSNADDNLIGLSDRRKYRVRWYPENLNFNFELKMKKNDLTIKKTLFQGTLNKKFKINDNKILHFLKRKNLKQICLVRYIRSYYYYNNLRITFDKNLEYTSFIYNSRIKRVKTNEQVIEIKYRNLNEVDYKFLKNFFMTRTRNSKYLNALNNLGILYF